jgi:uncharacterized protein (DUF2336 family)
MLNLTAMDVKRLTEEPSPKVRGLLATKIAVDYRTGHFTPVESDIANDIFRILLKDVEMRIRAGISEQLAHCPQAPHDIILALAQDEADVAAPVLEFSGVLSESDLLSIVRSTHEVLKLRAVARRERVEPEIADSLIDTGHELVLGDLFANKGAALSEEKMLEIWDNISDSEPLLATLVHRGGLPLVVAEKVFFAVSNDLKRELVGRYKFNTPVVHKAVSDIREWEMLGIIPAHASADPYDDEQVEALIDELYASQRLTHSLLIRALCVGNLTVFEAGLARLAGVPRVNARILILDAGELGLQGIYKAAGMPEGFYDAVHALLRISLEETEYGRIRHADFRKRVIDRIYAGQYHRTIENMEYMLSIIGGKIVAADSVH